MSERSSLAAAALLITTLSFSTRAIAQCSWTPSTSAITETCGSIGIGTASPVNLLDVRSAPNTPAFMSFGSSDTSHFMWMYNGALGDHEAIGWKTGDDLRFGTVSGITPGSPFSEKVRIKSSGNVGIGMTAPAAKLDVAGNIHSTGDITADGALYAKYQDVAEWVPATVDMQPGTVVVLNRARDNEVTPSSNAYDTAVAGVVSAQPGVVLGERGPSKEQVATTGRVKVKVDATIRPIHIGDLLVTSSKPGVAMVSQPVEIGGIAIHRPGTLIGKALQPLDSGMGEILVLLSLQ